MASQHVQVRACETVPILLPSLRLRDAGSHRDPQVALEDEACLMRELRRMRVSMLLETTVAYALTMMRSRTWSLGEAADWCKTRGRESQAARAGDPEHEAMIAQIRQASRTGMVLSYRLGRPGYPECPDCGESSGHAEDCAIVEVWG